MFVLFVPFGGTLISMGDKPALDDLMPVVYDELRRLAQHYLSRERAGHTLLIRRGAHSAQRPCLASV